jgi:hypothetical protein
LKVDFRWPIGSGANLESFSTFCNRTAGFRFFPKGQKKTGQVLARVGGKTWDDNGGYSPN